LFYYKKPQKSGRAIFFVFGTALTVVLDRLMEVNVKEKTENSILDGIIVVALPFANELIVPNESAEMKKFNLTRDQFACHKYLQVYKYYAKLFYPVRLQS